MNNTVQHQIARLNKAIISSSDDEILAAFNRYYYLTSNQILRLLYSAGSLTYVQARLKRLVELGYCQRVWLPRARAHGSAPSVFRLARLGLNYLKSRGENVPARFRPAEHAGSALFLNHTLALNDFLIAAELLTRSSSVRLAAMQHEQELKKRPLHVDLGQRVAVVPDAWLDLRVAEVWQACLLIELDMGTEEQKRFRQKVAGLAAIINGPYEAAFHTKSLTIAVVSANGARRMRELVNWTEAELSARGEQELADFFAFSTHEATDAPQEVFLSPRWYQPFHPDGIAILQDGL